jgi:hypothetical protein
MRKIIVTVAPDQMLHPSCEVAMIDNLGIFYERADRAMVLLNDE